MIENVRIIVDESIVAHNTELLRETLNKNTKIISVIKANGYGLGLTQIAKTCETLNIDILAVLDLPQAIELRNSGIQTPILLLGQTHEDDFDKLVEYDCIQVLLSKEFALRLSDFGTQCNVKVKSHLKVNTGLNRLGFDVYEDIKDAYSYPGLDIQGIYSHFAEAQNYDSESVDFSQGQIDRFNDIIGKLKEDGINPGLTHMQNSPSIIRQGDLGYDAVRCGMVMFGLYHPSQLDESLQKGYRVPLKLESQIALIRDVKAGVSIGYGQSYRVTKPMRVATISAGYCDGITKSLSLNGGYVIINDKQCPILGDIAMSQFMVDVTNVECKAEDPVILFGHEDLTIYDYIGFTKQSINELIGALRLDIPRIYINKI